MESKVPQITIERIEKLDISSKKEVTQSGIRHLSKISFEAEVSPSQIARLLYFQKQGKPINVLISS
jgi:hypothetical protein